MYLQALVDCKQQYMDQYPPIEAETLSSEAVDSLEKIRKMHLTDPEYVPEKRDRFYYAKKLQEVWEEHTSDIRKQWI